jgi:CSLREA domain-containing protein
VCRRFDSRISKFILLSIAFSACGAFAQSPAPRAVQFRPSQALALEPSGKAAAAFQAQQPRPLAMASADFDEDGVADLAIGYGVNQGGAIALMRGNLDALAPRSDASWLAAGRGQFASPFLPQTNLIAVPVQPDLLVVADIDGDGHRDLVFAARNGNALYVLLGDGRGHFTLQPPVTVPGAVTALAAYRPGDERTADAVIAGVETNSGARALLFRNAAMSLQQRASYALPGAASAIEIANLDSDFTPDAAIVAGGQLLVLHGAGALAGAAEVETLPVEGAKAVVAGDFLFDRHAQLQLSVLTTDGTVHVLAHAGFDSTPYTREEIAAARFGSRQPGSGQRGSQGLALKASDTGGQPWIDVEDYPGIVPSSFASAAPLLLHSGISGSGGQDIVVLNSSAGQIATIHHAATLPGAAAQSVSPAGQAQVRRSSLGSGLVAALSQRVSPQGVDGLVFLRQGSISPEIVTPASGNVLYVNTPTDSADANDTARCTQGSAETCSLRDAITFANQDSAINITDNTVDTIMVPAGTYSLTVNAGSNDANGNAETHLEILGPMTIIGSTSGGGVTVTASNNDTVFTINPGPYGSVNPSGDSYVFNATLENLTIMGGRNNNNPSTSPTGLSNNVGGAINWDADGAGNLTLAHCTVTGNTVLWGTGGGIWIENTAGGGTGTLTLTGGSVVSNSTPEEGGALYVAYPPAAFSASNTTFSNNEAKVSVDTGDPGALGQGGGLFIGVPGTSAEPLSTIQGGSISSNAADSDGGGIYTNEGISIAGGTVISGNTSGGAGGGIFHDTANNGFTETTSITAANITGNTAVTSGGGITVGTGTKALGNLLTIANSRIFSNTSTAGASGLSVGEPGTSGAGGATATENWWGCNAGPRTASDGCDQAALYDGSTGTLTTAPNIVLTIVAAPDPVTINNPLELTASVGTDSGGGAVSGGPGALQGLSVVFSATVGTFSGGGSAAIDSSGNAAVSVTPNSGGSGTASATLDNQTTTANITVNAGPATHFSLVFPSPVVSYNTYQLTITALDAGGNVANSYTGTVHFTSTDPGFVNPNGDVTLTNGTGVFNFALKTAGTQAITAIDTVNAAITGTSNPITVLPGPADRFGVSAPASAVLGSSFTVTVSAFDLYGNLATSYAGTVHFTSTDGAATLPADSTLTNGQGVFNATLHTAGNQTITATDTVTSSITGTSGAISVTIPNLVVTTATDDAGTAAHCTAQTAPGTGTDASCSLRDALLEAGALGSGSITFDSTKFAAAQTIQLLTGSGSLNIPSDTSITGPVSTGAGVTVSGGGATSNFQIFVVGSGETGVSIANLTIENGNSLEGSGLDNLGAATVSNCTFTGNSANSSGFGAAILNSGKLTVTSSTLSGNHGPSAVGGAIYNVGQTTITDSTIAGNSAASGGAIYNVGTLTVTGSIVAGNTASTAYADIDNLVVYNDGGGNQAGVGASGTSSIAILLSALGSYGGPAPTMRPLPGSPAICFINPSAASGTDQRGDPRTTTYGAATCQDSGAVQTNYALSFTTEPPATVISGASFSAAVTLTESGQDVSGVSIPVTLNGAALAGSPVSATTGSNGVGSYSLTVTTLGPLSGLTLTATLPSPPTLTATSSSFNLAAPAPAVVAISPNIGVAAGGTLVTVSGTHFTGTTAVLFGASPAASYTVNSDISITAVSPPGAGTVNVTVTTPGGQSATSAADQFTYVTPIATSLTPTVTPGSTFVYGQQPAISVALSPSNATGIVAGDFTATLDGTTALTITAGTGDNFNIALPATLLSVGAHSIAVNFSGVTPYYLGSSTTIPLTVTTPGFVVTTTLDDAATASNCTAQAAPGTGTDASCSLRDALAAAAAAGGASITFDSTKFATAQTITLQNGTLEMKANTILAGPGATLLSINGNALSEVMQVDASVTAATISGLTITNGNDTTGNVSGGLENLGTLTVADCVISGNRESEGGGGISNVGNMTLTDSTVSGNAANTNGTNQGFAGGGIYNEGTLTVTNSTVYGNTSVSNGAGIFSDAGVVAVTDSTVYGNTSSAGNGGGIYSTAQLTLAGNIVAKNTALASADESGAYTDGGGNLIGTAGIDLSPLGSYGGPTQTLVPLPGSPAICAISPSAATGTDQRGEPRTTTYGATTCQDAGAVETNYSLKFTQQPTTVVQNATMSPSPTVELLESGTAFADGTDTVTIPIALTTGAGPLTGGSASTSATTGVAAYVSLSIATPGTGDVLTASLTLNGASTPATKISLASNPFDVTPAVTHLAFGTPPAATVTAGGNAGSAITVDEENVTNSIVTEAQDTITLTVTGPAGYLKTYTANAVNGVAVFNLSSAALSVTGTYSYSATVASNAAIAAATASETVTAASPASIAVVSGTPQSAVIGATFAAPLKVLVKDQFNNPVAGESVAFAAPASGASAAITASPATTASDGTASVTATANGTASATAYTVAASVSGVSASANFLLTNTQSPTTLTVTPAPLAPVYGQAVTIAAAIAPSAVEGSSPTGAVTFYDGSTTLTPPGTVANAAASYSVSVPTVGSHSYAAKYSGDTNFLASAMTNATSAVVVGKAASTLSGPASPVSLTYGVGGAIAISITGQFAGAGVATPSGSLSYTIGGGTAQTIAISAGTATIPIPATLDAGGYAINVSYAGDGNYNAATPLVITLAIGQAATTTTLTASSGTITPGQSIKFTATVTSATTGTPTGMVSFYDGTTLLGSATLTAGAASYSTAALAAGVTHSISATYSGSTDYLPSTSTSSISVVVAPLDFTITIVGPGSATVVPGSTISYTVDVKPDYGAYAGTVNFTISGLPPGATANFSPANIAASGGAQTVTVNIQTAASAMESSPPAPTGRRLEPFAFALLLLFGMGGMRRYGRNVRRMLSVAILLTAGAAAAMLSGCGGNGFFTQSPKNYSVTITATSGALTHSATVTLNVQ